MSRFALSAALAALIALGLGLGVQSWRLARSQDRAAQAEARADALAREVAVADLRRAQADEAAAALSAALARERARGIEFDAARAAFANGEWNDLPPDFRDAVLRLLRGNAGR